MEEPVDPRSAVPLLATRDETLAQMVQASGLALGVPVQVVSEREQLRQHWAAAPVRLLGSDMASRAGAYAGQAGMYVVGRADAALLEASAALRVPALALPQSSAELAEVLSHRDDGASTAPLLGVVGASGGLGASTLAAGLALQVAARGGSPALVEVAACGGGVDLLLGAEATPGARWDQLSGASGQVGQLDGLLPRAEGVTVVSLSREHPAAPPQGAVASITGALGRSHTAVVVDAGRVVDARWDHTLLVVGADVRGVAAARMTVEALELAGALLVVRSGPGRGLPADAVAAALGMALLGEVRHDAALPRLAANGTSVAAPAARRFRRDVARLWEALPR